MTEILFIAHRIPFPPDRGDKIRSWHVLKYLAERARVHLACFADDEADAAHLDALKTRLCDRLGGTHVEVRSIGKAAAAARALSSGKPLSLTLFDSPRLREFVEERLSDPRLTGVYVFSGQMAQYVPATLRQRFVMDFVDMDSEKFAAYAGSGSGVMRHVHAREAKRLFAFERQVAERADVSLFVSNAEAELFRRRSGLANVQALANGIDSDHFSPHAEFVPLASLPVIASAAKQSATDGWIASSPAAPRDDRTGRILLFTGQMDYQPNVDAVCWFAREVLPQVPDARFVIAGRNPAPDVTALASERVTVTGAVRDMRSWLAAADVVVAPLRIARGIQNKVLEAMAMARPVVASPAAFEGIDAEPGKHLLVAEAPAATAEAIAGLLANPSKADELGVAARELVRRTYRWEARLEPLAGLLGLDAPARKAA